MNELAHLHGARHGRTTRTLLRLALSAERLVREGKRELLLVSLNEHLARFHEERLAKVAAQIGCTVEYAPGQRVTVDGFEFRFVGMESAHRSTIGWGGALAPDPVRPPPGFSELFDHELATARAFVGKGWEETWVQTSGEDG